MSLELLDFLAYIESAESCQSGQQETAAASISLCTRRIGKCTKALRKHKTLVAHSSYIAIDVLLRRTLLQCHEDFEDAFAFYDERRAPQPISHDVYPVSTGILPHSLPEWAFRARPGLWRICLCPKVARIAEQKFGSR